MDLEITKLLFIIYSFGKGGGAAYEDNDTVTEWRVYGNGGVNFAFG